MNSSFQLRRRNPLLLFLRIFFRSVKIAYRIVNRQTELSLPDKSIVGVSKKVLVFSKDQVPDNSGLSTSKGYEKINSTQKQSFPVEEVIEDSAEYIPLPDEMKVEYADPENQEIQTISEEKKKELKKLLDEVHGQTSDEDLDTLANFLGE